MERQWVLGPRGEYLVVVGRAAEVNAPHVGDSEYARSSIAFYSITWTLLRRVGRELVSRGGMVAVHWRGERQCAWSTPDVETARSVGLVVHDLLASGEWVPQSMPQPDLAGAEPLLNRS